ncbi:hypothetical protein AAF712_014033 [Marasmius tenuissimus]|uniref:Uncharacterized protein n=1 Tax=Marasmius tenuissimus TaxID=585030 RepID=A0ABR2ZD75_9AGAR
MYHCPGVNGKQVTRRWADWSVDFKTSTWYYNPAFLSLNPPSEGNLELLPNPVPPLLQDTPPRLDATEILVHVEETLGDFLYLIASSGVWWICDLSMNEAMDDPQLRNTLASFIHNVLVIYDATPVYRAPRYIQEGASLPEDDTFIIPDEDDQVELLYA